MKIKETRKCAICVQTFRVLHTSKRKTCSSEHSRKYRDTPENKAKRKAIRDTPEYKAKQKAYRDTPENKAKQKAYQDTPEYKAKRKAIRERLPKYDWKINS